MKIAHKLIGAEFEPVPAEFLSPHSFILPLCRLYVDLCRENTLYRIANV